MRGLANLPLAVGLDLIRGQMGPKVASQVLSSVRETRKTIQAGQQIGEHKEVLDDLGDTGDADLVKEERRLTQKLEKVRERRGA